jgi:hypothetical protein
VKSVTRAMRVYEVRPRKDKRDSRSNFQCAAIRSPVVRRAERNRVREVFSHSHDAVIRIYDAAGNVIETYEHAGDFKEW